MSREIEELYKLIPYDTTIRKHKLARLLRKSNNNYSILFSLQEHCNFSSISITTNTTPSTPRVISKVINTIVNTASPSEASKAINMLHTNDQIVIKHLITGSLLYNKDTVISNIPKLYTLRDLIEEVYYEESVAIPFVIHRKPLDYTYRSNTNTMSSIKDISKRPNVPPNLCYVTDGDRLVMVGDRSLYTYMIGQSLSYFTSTKLPSVQDNSELEKIHTNSKGRYVTLFKDVLETTYIPKADMKVQPMDWTIDSNFNPSGFVFKHGERVYKIKHKIPRTLIEKGLENIKLAITYTQRGSILTHIKIKEVIIEE